ncbi:MAG: ABC-2 transporter permease [Burkholderiaceae bacterium]|nr:ABC-2 transporter permease [Burkholderiaceae bacterium]
MILGLVLVGIAYLSAAFSPRQPKTVALDVGLSGIRFSLVMFSLFWVQELVGHEIQRRTVLFALTYPVSRGQYLIGRYLAVLGMLALAAVMLGMLLWIVVLNAGGRYEQVFGVAPGVAYWLTILGLWIDVAVVAAFALCIASLSTVPMLPFALGLAFAAAGKSLGAVAEYLSQGAGGDLEIMRLAPVVDAIHWFLPDLSRLDWRAWPMYGIAPDTSAMTGSGMVALAYIVLLVTLAVLAFNRREFE